ncbi:unnamed protein product, partial [Meganyctiphanes norvegica]
TEEAFKHKYNRSPPGELNRCKSLNSEDLTNVGRLLNEDTDAEMLEVLSNAKKICQHNEDENGQDEGETQDPGPAAQKVNTAKQVRQSIEGKPIKIYIPINDSEITGGIEITEDGQTPSDELETENSGGTEKSDTLQNAEATASNTPDSQNTEQSTVNVEANTEMVENNGEEIAPGGTEPEEANNPTDNDGFVIVMEFKEEDSDLLRCPIDINAALRTSTIAKKDVRQVQTNLRRNMLVLVADHKNIAEKWLEIKLFGGKEVNCRWTIHSDNSNTTYGIIGPIPCPNHKETMEQKKLDYITLLNENLHEGTSQVTALDWVSKREKVNNVWTTTMTQNVRLQFSGNAPDKVFIGSISYTVEGYVPEVVQCFNCQNYGHTSKHCRSNQPVCVFCSAKGHRVKDRQCRRNTPRCYHCKEEHPSSYKGCPRYKKEKAALKLKYEAKIDIHYARKIITAQGNLNPQRPRSYSQSSQSSQETTQSAQTPNAVGTSYRDAAIKRRAQENRPKFNNPAPISGTPWGELRRKNISQTEGGRTNRNEERENRRRNQNTRTERQILKKTKSLVTQTLKELLPDVLGNILMGFFTMLSQTMNREEGNQEEINHTVKIGMKKLLTQVFSHMDEIHTDTEDNSDEDESNMETAEEGEEMELTSEEHTGSRRQEGRKWNPNKGRRAWKRQH